MSDTASGKGGDRRDDEAPEEDAPSGPEGEELPIDPDAGDELDPIERWWDDGGGEREIPRNRKLDADRDEQALAESASQEGPVEGESGIADMPVPPLERATETEDELAASGAGEDEEGLPDEEPAAEMEEEPAPGKPAGDRLPWEEGEPPAEGGTDDEAGEEEPPPLKTPEEEIEATPERGSRDMDEGLGLEPRGERGERGERGDGESTDASQDVEEPDVEEGDAEAREAPTEFPGGAADEDPEEEAREGDGDADSEPETEEEADERDEKSGDEEVESSTEKTEKGDGTEEPTRERESEEDSEPVAAVTDSEESEAPETSKASEPSEEAEKSEEEESTQAKIAESAAPAKRKAGCWTIFATLFFIATLLVVALLAGAAAFAWSRLDTVEQDITATAREKLAERGIHVEYAGWSYQFPRGLVFEDVSLFETEERKNAWLQASDLGVNVDVVSIARNRAAPESAEITFRDSEIRVSEGSERSFTLEEVTGELLVDRSRLEVERFTAGLSGARVHAAGRVDWPQAVESGGGGEGETSGGGRAFDLPPDLSALAKIAPWLELTSEGAPPEIDIEFAVNADEPEAASVSATARGGNFTWIGVPIASLSATCEYEPESRALRFDNFQLGYGEGLIGSSFDVDLENERLRIERLQCSVNLVSLLSDCDEELGNRLEVVRFLDNPTVRLSGTVPFAEPTDADLEIEYDHREGLGWQVGERELMVSGLRGGLDLSNGSLETNDFAARLFGGDVAINGVTRLTAETKPFNGIIEGSGLSLEEVAAWFGKEDLGMTGDMDLTFRGAGYRDVSRIRGGGKIRIEGAKLPAFPVIGPVQERLGQVVPAFGVQGEGTLTGNYLVESGILITNDLTVRQGGARLVVNGNLELDSLDTEFTATADLEPTLARATGLEDEEVVVAGSGPVTEPTLRLEQFPFAFASEKLGDVLGTSPETLGRLEEMLDDPERAADVIGAELEEAGVELSPEVSGLIQGLLGGEESGDEEEIGARAQPIEEDE